MSIAVMATKMETSSILHTTEIQREDIDSGYIQTIKKLKTPIGISTMTIYLAHVMSEEMITMMQMSSSARVITNPIILVGKTVLARKNAQVMTNRTMNRRFMGTMRTDFG